MNLTTGHIDYLVQLVYVRLCDVCIAVKYILFWMPS
jgi:hypothetical protein